MPSCKSEDSPREETALVVQIYVNIEVYSWPISVVAHVDIKDTVHVLIQPYIFVLISLEKYLYFFQTLCKETLITEKPISMK